VLRGLEVEFSSGSQALLAAVIAKQIILQACFLFITGTAQSKCTNGEKECKTSHNGQDSAHVAHMNAAPIVDHHLARPEVDVMICLLLRFFGVARALR